MDKVREFYSDKALFETVFETMLKKLEKMAVDKVFAGKDIVGIKEAKEIIETLKVEIVNKYKEVNNQVEENI